MVNVCVWLCVGGRGICRRKESIESIDVRGCCFDRYRRSEKESEGKRKEETPKCWGGKLFNRPSIDYGLPTCSFALSSNKNDSFSLSENFHLFFLFCSAAPSSPRRQLDFFPLSLFLFFRPFPFPFFGGPLAVKIFCGSRACPRKNLFSAPVASKRCSFANCGQLWRAGIRPTTAVLGCDWQRLAVAESHVRRVIPHSVVFSRVPVDAQCTFSAVLVE